jgi:hypothetical protein
VLDLDEAFHALENLDSEGRKALRLVVKVLGEISGDGTSHADLHQRHQIWFPPIQRKQASRSNARTDLEERLLRQQIEISELRIRLDDALDGRELAEIRAERAERQHREMRAVAAGCTPGEASSGEPADESRRQLDAMQDRTIKAIESERRAWRKAEHERNRANAAETERDGLRAEVSRLRGFLVF